MTQLAPTLEAYFTLRLIGQRQASPHTVASYRVPRTRRSEASTQGR